MSVIAVATSSATSVEHTATSVATAAASVGDECRRELATSTLDAMSIVRATATRGQP
jgi:hypothetical protein